MRAGRYLSFLSWSWSWSLFCAYIDHIVYEEESYRTCQFSRSTVRDSTPGDNKICVWCCAVLYHSLIYCHSSTVFCSHPVIIIPVLVLVIVIVLMCIHTVDSVPCIPLTLTPPHSYFYYCSCSCSSYMILAPLFLFLFL